MKRISLLTVRSFRSVGVFLNVCKFSRNLSSLVDQIRADRNRIRGVTDTFLLPNLGGYKLSRTTNNLPIKYSSEGQKVVRAKRVSREYLTLKASFIGPPLGLKAIPNPCFLAVSFACLFVPRGPVNFETENSELKMSCPPGINHLFPIAARIACTFSTLVTRCVEPRVVRSRHATLALP